MKKFKVTIMHYKLLFFTSHVNSKSLIKNDIGNKKHLILLFLFFGFSHNIYSQERVGFEKLEYVTDENYNTHYLYKGEPFTGISFTIWNSDQLKSEINWKDGRRHGPYVWYHNNGKLEKIGNYVDGKVNGLEEIYYENGQLNSRSHFTDGKRSGLQEHYYENGQLGFKGIIINHYIMQGQIEEYYVNGQLKFKGSFTDGMEDGLHEEYYENGQLKFKGFFTDGKENGLHEAYFENGQLDFKKNWVDYKRHGLHEDYDENGKIVSRGNWVNDQKHGLHESILPYKGPYKSQTLSFVNVKVNWVNGKIHGISEIYYENGQLSSRTTYQDGRKKGPYESYNEYGVLIEKGIH